MRILRCGLRDSVSQVILVARCRVEISNHQPVLAKNPHQAVQQISLFLVSNSNSFQPPCSSNKIKIKIKIRPCIHPHLDLPWVSIPRLACHPRDSWLFSLLIWLKKWFWSLAEIVCAWCFHLSSQNIRQQNIALCIFLAVMIQNATVLKKRHINHLLIKFHSFCSGTRSFTSESPTIAWFMAATPKDGCK